MWRFFSKCTPDPRRRLSPFYNYTFKNFAKYESAKTKKLCDSRAVKKDNKKLWKIGNYE